MQHDLVGIPRAPPAVRPPLLALVDAPGMTPTDPLLREERLRRAEMRKRALQEGVWSLQVDREITHLNELIAALKEETP